ncbi:MAG TPA: hypothetical protein VGD67_21365 [Pseudonocardiaceae bacterium]
MTPLTTGQARQAEHIVRRWRWADRLSAPSDRAVEQAAVGELAVALLAELLAVAGAPDQGVRPAA